MSSRRTGPMLALVALIATTGALAGTAGFSDAAFTSATTSSTNQISAAADWNPPLVALTLPESPLTGTVTITATADDPEGSATTVRVDVATTASSTWTEICPAAPSPQSCTWDTTTVPDGDYDVRATGTDTFDNTAATTVTVTISNTTSP